MRKKLTGLGVLSALVLGAVGLFGGGPAFAGHATPIQNFDVNNSICYGSAPAGTFPHSIDPVCPGTSAEIAPASSSAPTYQMTLLDQGSRLTLPVIYTPTSFGFTPGAVSSVVGNVTSLTDLLCDGSLDILAGGTDPGDPAGPSPSGGNVTSVWPDSSGWIPYNFVHKGTAPADLGGPLGIDDDAYVGSIKPTPSTFTAVSHDKANLYTLWLGKTGPLFLPSIQNGLPTPLNTVTELSPYAPLRVSVTMLAGNPSPPSNSFLTCLDSPQNALAENTQLTTPAAPGLYPRWTAYTSAADIRSGNVSRVIDLSCVEIGGAITDTDDDCIEGGPGDLAGADSDGDFLVDGIEAANGSNPGLADTDGDGATDFDELFQFTDPNNPDTDGDGSLDKQDNGSDEVPGGAVQDTTADDNCPAIANAAQTNSDYANDYNGVAGGDPTNPSQDSLGDACDADDDNDRMSDAAEGKLHILASAGGFCKPNTDGGAVFAPSSPTDPDVDDDLGLDGAECKFDSNPQDFASKMAVTAGDNLADGAAETFYRTQKINITGGSQNDNPDGDGFATGDADSDSDNDRLIDGSEVKFYGTDPSNADTDHDGCPDGKEAASVNGDRTVSAIDLSQVAQRFGAYTPSLETSAVPLGRVNYDYTKDRSIGATDLSQVAGNFGPCPDQAGVVITRGNTVPLP